MKLLIVLLLMIFVVGCVSTTSSEDGDIINSSELMEPIIYPIDSTDVE